MLLFSKICSYKKCIRLIIHHENVDILLRKTASYYALEITKRLSLVVSIIQEISYI